MGGGVNFNIVALISLTHHLPGFWNLFGSRLTFRSTVSVFPSYPCVECYSVLFSQKYFSSEASCFEYNDRDHLSYVPVIKSRLQQWFSKSLTSSVWPAARVTFNKFPRIIIITTRYCSVDLLPRSSFSTSVAIQVLCPALSSRLLVILLLVIFSALSSACKKVPRSASTPRSHSPHFDWGHFSKTARLQHMLQSLSLFTSNFWNLKKNLFSRHNNLICIKIKIKSIKILHFFWANSLKCKKIYT